MQCKRPGFDPWVRKIPWRRVRQPTPVSLPGESHGQRSLAGCSPWGHRVGHGRVPEQQQAATSPLPPDPGPATALERIHAPTDSSQGPGSAGPRGLRTNPADESHAGRPAPSPVPGAPVLEEGLSPKPTPTSQDPAETREKQGERPGLEKGQSKSELRVPHAAGSHLVGISCSGERSSLSLGKDGGRCRAFGRHLGVQEKGGRAPRQQLHCQPQRRARDHLERSAGQSPPQRLRVHEPAFHTAQEQVRTDE